MPSLVLVLTTTMAACGGGGGGTAASPTTAAAPAPGGGSTAAPGGPSAANTVDIRLSAFKPERLSVAAGTKVTWRQDDPGVHTVTSGTVEQEAAGVREVPDGKFASGQLATGATFSQEFDAAGTFPFFCEIHPATMRGEISVS